MTSAPVQEATTHPPAGLDRRFYAFALDRLVAWPLLALAAYLAHVASWRDGGVWGGLLVLVLGVALVGTGSAALLALRGATPGKAVLGLRVVDATSGAPLRMDAALRRVGLVGLAGLPTFGLGVATLAQTAVLDPERCRRGWHDRVAGSVVVDVRPPAEPEPVVEEPPHRVVNLTTMSLTPSAAADPWWRTPEVAPVVERMRLPGDRPTGAHRAEPALASSDRWSVTVDTGETVPVDGLVLLGRRPQPRDGEEVGRLVSLTSQDMSVSKTHAELQVATDGSLVVSDRGSTNGSALLRDETSRDLPPGQPTTLLPGDVVVLGDRRLTVSRED